ncbi:MAG: RNA methyltransferase, partial [Verrucomicrobiota bacterium]
MALTKAELQRLRSLREKKNREALGLFVVEGEKVVSELIAARFPFTELYTTGGVALRPAPPSSSASTGADTRIGSAAAPPRLVEVTAEEMARASHFPTPSTVLAVGSIARAP